MVSDDRYAKATRAQQIGGSIAIHADEIRHHVGRAVLPAVDEERDLGPGAFSRRILRDDRAGGVVRRPDFCNRGELESVLLRAQLRRPFGLSQQGRHRRGARPAADPHLDAPLAARADSGLRILRDDLADRHGRVDTPRFFDLEVESGRS